MTYDMLEYRVRSPANYEKVLTDPNHLDGISAETYFKHVNGDIDIFCIKFSDDPDGFELHKLKNSENMFTIDCDTDISDNNFFGAKHVPGNWMPRYWDVGDVLDVIDTVTLYNPLTHEVTDTFDSQTRFKFISAGNSNFGNIGSVDWVCIDDCYGFGEQFPSGYRWCERNYYAKDWGWIHWELHDEDVPVIIGGWWVYYYPYIQKPSPVRYESVLGGYTPRGPYLFAEGGGGSQVSIDRAFASIWEQFTVTKVYGDVYNIRAYNGKYLCAENGGGGVIVANRDVAVTWEQFRLIQQPDGYYAIKTFDDQHYVCAEGGGEQPINATRTAVGPWEKFGFHHLGNNVYNIWTYNKDVFGPEFATMPSLSVLP